MWGFYQSVRKLFLIEDDTIFCENNKENEEVDYFLEFIYVVLSAYEHFILYR